MRTTDRLILLPVVIALGLSAGLHGNVPTAAWPDGNIPLLLQLDAPGRPALPTGGLADRSANWNAAVGPAITAWNAHMSRSRLTSTNSTSSTTGRSNGVNNVFFSSTIYGEAFGSRVLAVTLSSRSGVRGVRITESDVIFNTGVSWDAYRGGTRARVDIRRVAMHEFGHVIGLDHPEIGRA